MVRKISDTYHLPYFTITPTFSVCPVHGYLSGEHEYCPRCDEEIAEAEANSVQVSGGVVESDIEIDGHPEAERSMVSIKLEKPLLNSQVNLGGDTYGAD